jgi:Tfp pilus assembly PilM family ATPase
MGISFGSKHLLAFQIDNGVTQVAELRVSGKNATVLKSFSVLTPMGTVESDGTLIASAELAALLREQMKKHGIKTDRGVFCVNSDRVITRQTVVQNLKRNEILSLLSTNSQDYFPVDVSDYKLDYSVQEQFEENGTKMLRIQINAVPKPLIASYYELAKMMEIGIEAVDLSGNSLLQAVGVNPDMIMSEEDEEGSTYLIANLYSGGTQLTFIKDGTVRLQRTISNGLGDSFDTLMLANADRSSGILGYVLSADMDREEMERASEVANAKAAELTAAINRIIEYYYSVEGYGNGKIYGTAIGQGVLLPAFVSLLFKELDIELRTTHRIGADAEDADKEYGLYLPCIGACLHPLNLTDRALSMTLENICAKRRWLERAAIVKRNFIILAGAAIFAVCVLVSALMAGIVTVENLTTQATIDDYRTKIEVLSEVAKQHHIKLNAESVRDALQAYKQKLAQLEQDEQIYESLKAEHEQLAETYLALKEACEQLELDFAYTESVYNKEYAVYEDFSKSIWSWYEEVMFTMDEDFMNTYNDNIVSFMEELEDRMPSTFTVTAIAVTDQGINMGIEVQSKEQVIYVIQELREFDTVEIVGISGLTIVGGGYSDLFEEEIDGPFNPTQRVRFTVALKYTELFREQN